MFLEWHSTETHTHWVRPRFHRKIQVAVSSRRLKGFRKRTRTPYLKRIYPATLSNGATTTICQLMPVVSHFSFRCFNQNRDHRSFPTENREIHNKKQHKTRPSFLKKFFFLRFSKQRARAIHRNTVWCLRKTLRYTRNNPHPGISVNSTQQTSIIFHLQKYESVKE